MGRGTHITPEEEEEIFKIGRSTMIEWGIDSTYLRE